MGGNDSRGIGRAQWLALTAALLGWMFDGLEQGLFPLAGRPALRELLATEHVPTIGRWFAVTIAAFLVGAATGGVLFGWLGDRIGRVRAMTLSVLTYSIFSALCAFAGSSDSINGFVGPAAQMAILRFIAALGMGGEWSLGVALVMEIWPDRSRALLAGLIGAAANVGYALLAVVGLQITAALSWLGEVLPRTGMPESWVADLMRNSGWRLIMLVGAVPALLTFFIRLFVPESERWQHEHGKGTTSHWATQDLLGVLIGSAAGCSIIYLWAEDFALPTRLAGTVAALIVVTLGYLYPVVRYLQRSHIAEGGTGVRAPTLRRMLLGASLGGVALLGTWASMQWAAPWADQLAPGNPDAKAYTQFWSAIGAILGTILGALLGDFAGRRISYSLLCLSSLGSSILFFQGNSAYGTSFLAGVFLAGGTTAAFYGWLPLYLPELFGTRVRATGQGFSFNFGRIIAAVGVLQTGNLTRLFEEWYTKERAVPNACSMMSLIYVVGLGLIWLAPETRGKPLPE